MQSKNLSNIAVLASALLLSACGSLSSDKDETKNWSAEKLYSEAMDELSSGGYDKSVTLFEKLESRYPFGVYAQQAQMEIAYAHYRADEQPEAIAAVERFIKLHPNHPNVDYLYYLRGLINFNDKLGPLDFISNQDQTERDPKAAREAFDSFKLLVDRYPDSKYAPDAIMRMKYLVNTMAKYEVHVGNYYYRRGAYVAALNRAQTVVKQFTGTPATEDALYLMMRCYDRLGEPDLRDDTARVFKANYPNSTLVADGGRIKPKAWWQFW
jgi:outer membrane protein assembly factor BamD